jgi:hypothetical protein
MEGQGEAEERQSDVGILTKIVQTVDDIPHISVSSLSISKDKQRPHPKRLNRLFCWII